jgi:Asp-tRNA(Asn)/Glu-tRNA(Gln) amidotransferase C subunit
MNEDTILYEVMLELAEEENEDLKAEIDSLYGYIQYLHNINKDLVDDYNQFVKLENRLN